MARGIPLGLTDSEQQTVSENLLVQFLVLQAQTENGRSREQTDLPSVLDLLIQDHACSAVDVDYAEPSGTKSET